MSINFSWFSFSDLSPHDLHEILWLRQQVFIIEQTCIYPDIDGKDREAVHLIARDKTGTLIGCLRLLPPGMTHACPAVGRLAISKKFRGQKMGHELMSAGVAKAKELFNNRAVYISAQHHLIPFYRNLGFTPSGESYDEDGILHIDMILPALETG